MKLVIAIPALDEEASIRSIIERTLAARPGIVAGSPVERVDVTVVSDGSTDRTVEYASAYADRVRLIVFPRNRGYGAAIQEAWRQSDAELLGFLDADGTCDPEFFAPLCRRLCEEPADIVLGNRMTSTSRMPALRRVGNVLFAGLLTVFASRRVRDTASGMRVVRRSALPKLGALPLGLHFTPAMSARALLREDVRMVEIPMPYEEREGRSKLRPWRDGLRFLRTILDAVFLFRPSRLLTIAGLLSALAAAALLAQPARFYLAQARVEEWMIYRFVVAHLLGTAGVVALAFAWVARRVVRLSGVREDVEHRLETWANRFLRGPASWAAIAALLSAGIALVLPSLAELVESGATYAHWSRFVVMSFCVSTAFVIAVLRLVRRSFDLLEGQQAFQRAEADGGAPRGG